MVENSLLPLVSCLKGYFSGIQLPYSDSKQSENIQEVWKTTFPVLNIRISGKKLTAVRGLTVPGPAPPLLRVPHHTHATLTWIIDVNNSGILVLSVSTFLLTLNLPLTLTCYSYLDHRRQQSSSRWSVAIIACVIQNMLNHLSIAS